MSIRFWQWAIASLAVLFTFAPATAELELHLTFDDADNLAVDASGKEREVQVVIEETDLVFFEEPLMWVDDPVRGGVLEFPGGNNGFVYAELPQLTGEFTIMMWAQRSPDLCCDPDSGANDGLFHVTFDGDYEVGPPGAGNSKIIGGWVQKSDAAVWGRIHDENQQTINLDRGFYFMEDEEWIHLAYRGNGEDFEVLINGEEGEGPIVDYDGTLYDMDSIFVGKQGVETWGGRLDDVRVYSSALSAAEIREIMEGGGGGGIPGDLNGNGSLDADDMDLLSAEIRAGNSPAGYDLNGDSLVNDADRTFWIETLVNSYFGDANLDLEFNSGDLVATFSVGEYEDGVANNSGWADGDWDGNGEFDSGDFVKAFSAGGYEQGPRAATAAVPEPASGSLLLIAMALLAAGVRKR